MPFRDYGVRHGRGVLPDRATMLQDYTQRRQLLLCAFRVYVLRGQVLRPWAGLLQVGHYGLLCAFGFDLLRSDLLPDWRYLLQWNLLPKGLLLLDRAVRRFQLSSALEAKCLPHRDLQVFAVQWWRRRFRLRLQIVSW